MKIKSGKDIVMVGYAGDAGSKIILKYNYEELLKYFNSSYIEKNYNTLPYTKKQEMFLWQICGEYESFRVREGGVLNTLYDIAVKKDCGIRIRLKEVPVRQCTIEICEYYRINPYHLYSDALLFLCDKGEELKELLKEYEIEATAIGILTGGKDKVIIDKEEIEYINRPTKDEIHKVKI